MRRTFLYFSLLTANIFMAAQGVHANELPQREMFVSVIEKPQVLSNRDEISKLVSFAKATHIRVLYIQIYRANQTWFASTIGDSTPYKTALKSVGEDPLALLIKKAHAHGIEVHAWLNLLSLAKNTDAPLLKKYGPGILTKSADTKKTLEDYKIDEQYFLEPGDLRIHQELVNLVTEILSAYPKLDGIQFDYIRYPDTHPVYGYTKNNTERFKMTTGASRITDDDPAWKKWKRDQVTALLKKLIRKARSIKPGIHLSTTGCMGYIRAYEEAFQDWPSWVNAGLVEYVTIMSYPDSTPEFVKNITDAKKRVHDFSKVHVGIGVYKLLQDPESFAQQLSLCQGSQSGACVFFYYSNLAQTPALKEIITTSP
jgi:uncharacterized lipoprotein YddW (UPF0748 family)